MMINAKVTKGTSKENSEEKLFKLLESIDWKLWEIYNMMKDNLPEKSEKKSTSRIKKTANE
jgi:hypothetical protein